MRQAPVEILIATLKSRKDRLYLFPLREGVCFFVLFCLFLIQSLLWSGWPPAHQVAQNDLKLLIFLNPPLIC